MNQKNPIITPADQERFPLLEMVSQECDIPLRPAEEQAVIDMDAILDALGDEAAGLAAIQIGVPRRIFLLRNGWNKEEDKPENRVYINPVIVNKSTKNNRDAEACLSLPGMVVNTSRPKWLDLQYFDLSGQLHIERFKGFWARAVCHEIEHLNGTLIAKHLENQIASREFRTSFGMKVTPHQKNVIAQRRAKNKRARKARKVTRANGR